MNELVQKIIEVRNEIDSLKRAKASLSRKINHKKDRLKSLEELTVNQISMLDTDGF